MRPPDEVTVHLRQRFARDYPDWARGGGTWPMRVPRRPPDTGQRESDPVADQVGQGIGADASAKHPASTASTTTSTAGRCRTSRT